MTRAYANFAAVEEQVERMGIAKQVSQALKAKADKGQDRMEDPRKAINSSYQQQLEHLTKLRRGAADATASHERLEWPIETPRRRLKILEGEGYGVGVRLSRCWPRLDETVVAALACRWLLGGLRLSVTGVKLCP